MKPHTMIKLILIVLAGSACLAMLYNIRNKRTLITENLIPEAALDADESTLVGSAGMSNPKMMESWAGKYTMELWSSRFYHDSRDSRLSVSLIYYYAAFDRYPSSFYELENSGFFPIRPLDPATGQSISYNSQILSETDYINVSIVASEDIWSISLLRPLPPNGAYKLIEYSTSDDMDSQTYQAANLRMSYDNQIAIRGALLSNTTNAILHSYVSRRHMMPDTLNELLDGLLSIDHEWAEHNEDLELTQPNIFFFVLDEDKEIAYARWHDNEGGSYKKIFGYSPWPAGGWEEAPSFDEYIDYFEMYRSQDEGVILDSLPVDYVPPLILYQCSLNLNSVIQ